jgi:hypothetical protein
LTIVVANTAGKKINAKTVNGGYGILKRGLIGAYQHCAEQHLRRSLAEFDFRYSNRVRLGIDDAARAERASLGAVEIGAKAIRSLAPRRTRRLGRRPVVIRAVDLLLPARAKAVRGRAGFRGAPSPP